MKDVTGTYHLSTNVFRQDWYATLHFLSRLNDLVIFHGPDNKEYQLKAIVKYHRNDINNLIPDRIVFRTACDKIISLDYKVCLQLLFQSFGKDDDNNTFKVIKKAA